MTRNTIILLTIAGLAVGLLGMWAFGGFGKDVWICQDQQWVKYGNPSTPEPTIKCGKAIGGNIPSPLTKEDNLKTSSGGNTCEDSDGLDYYTKGQTTVCDFITREEPGGSPIGCALHEDFCSTELDSPGEQELYEYFCNGSKLEFEKRTCPNGCSNGACV